MTDPPVEKLTKFTGHRVRRHPCQQQLSRVRTATAQAGGWPGIRPQDKQFPRPGAAKTQYSRTVGCSNQGLGSRLRVRPRTRRFSTNCRIAVEPSKKSWKWLIINSCH